MKYYIVEFTIKNTENVENEDAGRLQTAKDLVAAIAAEAGFESFEETEDGLNGYVQTGLFDEKALQTGLEAFPMRQISINYTVNDAEDKDWNEAWEQEGFEPIIVGDKCVIHDQLHPIASSYPIDITIEARQAFGTGTHETTQMIVNMLLDMDMKGKRVLDCGCGTGILSMVAAKCGAKDVVAYDIDEWSVENTRHNSELNNVENINIFLGDVNVLSHVSGVFDVVLANINRNILLADMEHMKNVMNHGATFIISGFYKNDSLILAEKAGELGLSFIKGDSDNDWCCLSFKANEL